MDSAHKLTGKLQKLLERQQDVKLSGGKHPPSYSQLVVKLDTLFNNQKAINEANTKLTAMNTAATVSNYIRNKQLSHQMRSLQYNMSILEGTVDELQIEVVYQKGIIDRLRGEVKALKGCFDEAVKRVSYLITRSQTMMMPMVYRHEIETNPVSFAKYRQELEAQRKILRKQQASINSLFQASRTQDLILDSILLFTCLSISSLPLVTSFIQILTVAIRRDRSRQRWREGLRFMLFLYLIRRGRNMMQFYGVYKGVGKVEWWLANLAKGLGIDDKRQGKNIQG
ncbi:hypothetical protein BKA69DRAFT_1105657 [Paraphysoderma sedebokerense]|nr:hypothetical protein BKA69DRAFT_1105657 [Paraphysoderma sedebokerense]